MLVTSPAILELIFFLLALETKSLLAKFSHLAIWHSVAEPVHVGLLKVKEENKDLEANTQAEDSEAKGGFQEEDGI